MDENAEAWRGGGSPAASAAAFGKHACGACRSPPGSRGRSHSSGGAFRLYRPSHRQNQWRDTRDKQGGFLHLERE
eukprot:11862242-Alexandrium_andersonii.AAC.1